MHKVQPNQEVRIFQIEIAVPASAPDCEVRDEISALLSEKGIASDSHILDWQYTGAERETTAGDDPQEGEIFIADDGSADLRGKTIVDIRTMNMSEAEWMFWEYNDLPLVCVLNNGKVLFPASDTEGNGPGCFMAMFYEDDRHQKDRLVTLI
jgi:hypothetical protein